MEFDQHDDDMAAAFVEKMCDATQYIGNDYFNPQVAGGDPYYRERVYSYELYHKIRLRLPPNPRYVLNAEVDKRTHVHFRGTAAENTIPDLVYHTPGSMQGNLVVIEVKRAQRYPSQSSEGIEKDLKHLTAYRNVGYRKAIFLAFGSYQNYKDDVKKTANTWAQKYRDDIKLCKIDFYWHEGVGKSAVRVPW